MHGQPAHGMSCSAWLLVQAYRELLVTTPGLGQYISGAILFEETLYQNTTTGSTMVDELNKQGIVPGALLALCVACRATGLHRRAVCVMQLMCGVPRCVPRR